MPFWRLRPPWSPTVVRFNPAGSVCFTLGRSCLIAEMKDNVDAAPDLTIDNKTALAPRPEPHWFVAGFRQWTQATSRIYTTAPPTVLTLKASMVSGGLLRLTLYSKFPIFSVPAGVNQVLTRQRADHVIFRHAVVMQRLLLEICLHLTGKMSVGLRSAAQIPATRIRMDITTNV
jgi:hypothetical protein